MALLLKAAPIVLAKTQQLKALVQKLNHHGIKPNLKVVLVGDDPASQVYVEHKRKKCLEIGAKGEIIRIPSNASEESVLKVIHDLNNDRFTHGIILQLPVPKHLRFDPGSVIHHSKDVDGFSAHNLYHLYKNSTDTAYMVPCTPKGIIELLEYYNIPLTGKKVVILGRSTIVGKPMSLLALNANAAPTIVHSHINAKDVKEICQSMDIIISAIGRPNLVNKQFLRSDKSQVVIDVGINRLDDGRLVGDVDFNDTLPHVAAITPVPGGVGPMTVISLMENVVSAAFTQAGLEKELS